MVVQDRGTLAYRGTDGVRAGVGLVAFGGLLMDWSALLWWGLVRYWTGRGAFPVMAWQLLGWLSLTCLAVSLSAFFAPWELYAVGFWTVMVFGSLAVALLIHKRRGWHIFLLFGVLVVLTTVVGFFHLGLSVGMGLAVMAILILYIHLLLVVPTFGEWVMLKIEPQRHEQVPLSS
jgi:hypothetical protein